MKPFLLPMLALALATTTCAWGQVSISGGTPHDRTVVSIALRQKLAGLVLPDSAVSVDFVSPQRMHEIVRTGEDNDQSADSDDDIDGMYESDPSTIVLVSGVDTDGELSLTFVHEYGHHIWQMFLGQWDRNQYQRIYLKQAAAHQLVSEYAYDSVDEAFAESFAYYVLQPQTLLKSDPASYRFIQNVADRVRFACKGRQP